MQARWLKRTNDEGVEERFYPITHAKAVVMEDGSNLGEIKSEYFEYKNKRFGVLVKK